MTTRYPVEHLARAAGIPLGQIGGQQPDQPTSGTFALADRLGTSPRQIRRWRATGLTETQADRLACRLGQHPSQVWPSWSTDIDDPLDDLHGTAHDNATKTHGPQGHPYDHLDNRGRRRCRTCRAQTAKKCRENRKHAGQHSGYAQQFLLGTHT
jgi:hypothetical protein